MSIKKTADTVKPPWMDDTNHHINKVKAPNTGDITEVMHFPQSRVRSKRDHWKDGPTSGNANLYRSK